MRDIRTLDLNLLKALNALIEERSVTKAAIRLGLTQPAVSGILIRLRESFGDPLLVRAHWGMVPTSRALEIAPAVRQILMDIEHVLQPPSFDPASAEFTLAIAAMDYALSVLVTPFISTLRAEAPGIRTAIRPLSVPAVFGQLENGETDIAIMASALHSGLRVHKLFEEYYVCVMRENHPCVKEPWSLDLLCALDHALVAFDGGFAGVTDRILAEAGRKRRVVLSVGSFLALPTVLRSTDLIAVTPSRLVSNAPGLVQRAPPIPIPGFTVSVAWHERTQLDSARAWLRSLLIRTCGSSAE